LNIAAAMQGVPDMIVERQLVISRRYSQNTRQVFARPWPVWQSKRPSQPVEMQFYH
jgi:hypothetical protein